MLKNLDVHVNGIWRDGEKKNYEKRNIYLDEQDFGHFMYSHLTCDTLSDRPS